MGDNEHLEIIAKRHEFLSILTDARYRKSELIDALEVSRSTVDRAIGELEEAGLVVRETDGYTTTAMGHLSADRHRRHVEEVDDSILSRG